LTIMRDTGRAKRLVPITKTDKRVRGTLNAHTGSRCGAFRPKGNPLVMFKAKSYLDPPGVSHAYVYIHLTT
jgi:hypothetical protein